MLAPRRMTTSLKLSSQMTNLRKPLRRSPQSVSTTEKRQKSGRSANVQRRRRRKRKKRRRPRKRPSNRSMEEDPRLRIPLFQPKLMKKCSSTESGATVQGV